MSTLSISDLSVSYGENEIADFKNEQTLVDIMKTKHEINFLMAKAEVYSNNTTKNYRDALTPVKKRAEGPKMDRKALTPTKPLFI